MSSKKGKTNFFGKLLYRTSDKSAKSAIGDKPSPSSKTPDDVSKLKASEDHLAPPPYEDIRPQDEPGPSSANNQLNPYDVVLSQYEHSRTKLQSTWEGCKLGLRVLREVSEACSFLKAAVGAFLVVVDVIEVCLHSCIPNAPDERIVGCSQ